MAKIENFLYEKETYEIRGACFTVWKEFAGAFKESVVDKALIKELKDRGLKIESQKRIDVYYKGEKVGTYIPDQIVNDEILIEIKCKPFLTKEDEKQFWYYLKASKYKLGLLINFGPKKLDIKRRIYDKARDKQRGFINTTPINNADL
jgi:GxxExxY protein